MTTEGIDDKFEIIVRAIIRKNGKLLLYKQKQRGFYFFPGGHVEFTETAAHAIGRELKDEFGLSVAKTLFIGAMENSFVEDDIQHHEINLVFEVETGDIEEKAIEDNENFFFIDIEQLPKENILPRALKDNVINWLKDKKMFWASQMD